MHKRKEKRKREGIVMKKQRGEWAEYGRLAAIEQERLAMSELRKGTLFYDSEIGRYDIRFGLESYYGCLHCGECFDVKVKDAWIPVRIEMAEEWYLVGLPHTRLYGLTVRM